MYILSLFFGQGSTGWFILDTVGAFAAIMVCIAFAINRTNIMKD